MFSFFFCTQVIEDPDEANIFLKRASVESVHQPANDVKRAVQEKVREQVSERGREVRERTEEAREKVTGWR